MTPPVLMISETLALPIEAATARHVMLAKSGFGKTNASAVMTEEVSRAGVHTIVFDPLGKMHGLRSSADGESAGLQLAVLGGRHGDVPLRADRGAYVCDQLLEGPGVSAVIDTSQMEDDDESEFVIDFLGRIAIRADHVVMLVFEEAERFVPERSQARKGPHAKLAGVANRFVRECRNFGVGYVASTQRPQLLGKPTIEAAEFIYAMRMNGASAQGAIGVELGTRVDKALARTIISDVQGLERGGAWMIPDDEERFGEPSRFRFRLRDTFEIRPPKVGEGIAQSAPRVFAAIDLDRLREAMAEDAEDGVDEDDGLHARVERVEVPVLLRPEIDELVEISARIDDQVARFADAGNRIAAIIERATVIDRITDGPAIALPEPKKPRKTSGSPASNDVEKPETLGAGPRKILAALAATKNRAATRTQLAFLSGFAHGGGSYARYLTTLRSVHAIEDVAGRIVLTEIGRWVLGEGAQPPAVTTADVLVMFSSKLGAGPKRMFYELVAAWPGGLTRDALAEASGYEASGGSFARYLTTLNSAQLTEKKSGVIRLVDELFPTGKPK